MPKFRALQPISYVEGGKVVQVNAGVVVTLTQDQAATIPASHIEYISSGTRAYDAPRATFLLFDSHAHFPVVGSEFHVYLDQSTGKLYRWTELSRSYEYIHGSTTTWEVYQEGPPRLWRQKDSGTGEWVGEATDLRPELPPVVAMGDTAAEARDAINAVSPAEVDTAIDTLIGGAPGTRDTLKEISDALSADEGALASLTSVVSGKYVKPVGGIPLQDLEAEVVPAADASTVFGAGFLKNASRDWYGESFNIGNVANSFGWAGTPDTAPSTTTTSAVTFPITNGTVPVADCAQLSATGGSFTLGGKRVAYLGRSASSGPGNATGCYSEPDETGIAASGTALANTPTGFFGLTIHQRFGYDGRPNVGSTQGFGVVTAYRSPTLDDSAESGSFVVNMADSGAQQVQHRTVTGGEMTANLIGHWLLPDGYTGALTGGGARTSLSATDHAKQVIGFKLSPQFAAGAFMQGYDALYQTASGYQQYGTLNGAATFPQATVPVTGTFPPATPQYPATVRVGCNAQGMGGTVITYAGQSGGNLTGCTGGTGTWASGSNIGNTAFGANLKDPILSGAGFLASLPGWSAQFALALKGVNDSVNSMMSLTGPTNTEFAGGLTLLRLVQGVGQTKALIETQDSGGTVRFAVGATGAPRINGVPFTIQQSGVNSAEINSIGFIRPGISTSAWAGKGTAPGARIYSGSGVPGTALIGASGNYTQVGDLYIRTDGGVGSTLYRCTAVTGSNPPTSIEWTAIL